MANTSTAYKQTKNATSEDLLQAIYDRLSGNNPDTTATGNATIVYDVQTNVANGVIEAGWRKVSISNIGNANGTIQGKKVVPGQTVNFEALFGQQTIVIPFDSTGTDFAILKTS